MPHWIQITTAEQLNQYHNLVKSANEAYLGSTLDGLQRLLSERKGQAFMYVESEDDLYYYLLLLTPCLSKKEQNVWKLVHVIPAGDFEPEEAVKTMMRQIRQVVDELGITRFYGRPLKQYNNPKVVEFYDKARQMLWEIDRIDANPDKKFYTYHFHRDPDRHDEDELFSHRKPTDATPSPNSTF